MTAPTAIDPSPDTSPGAKARRARMRVAQTTRADRLTRRVLTTLSIIVLAAAVAGLVASYGGFGDRRAHSAVLTDHLRSDLHDVSRLVGIALAVVALVIGLLALRWLVRMLVPGPAGGDVHVPAGRSDERTIIRRDAVVAVVEAELGALPGVTSATAQVDDDGHLVRAWVEATPDLRGQQLRSDLDHRVLARLRRALSVEPIHLEVELRPTTTTDAARVS